MKWQRKEVSFLPFDAHSILGQTFLPFSCRPGPQEAVIFELRHGQSTRT
jgi:hypothetical protein